MAQRTDEGGLSVQTLIIASLASLTAAIVVHEVWEGGAILGAAITPIIVAITSEALRKPTRAITTIREERVSRSRATPAPAREGERSVPRTQVRRPAAPPPPEFERPDPFGIWEDGKPKWRDRLSTLDGRHVKLAIVTGLVAFGVAVFALTVPELILGGNVGGGSKRTTIFGGGDKSDSEKKTDTTEQPGATTPVAPEEATPEQPAPTATQPAPAETAPAPEEPAPQEPAPAPAPEAPAPETPAPTP